ncbi:mitochondrial arginine transporter BAC2 [Andrographis paniculata]|uniref:mitochondrial arginine transporter BAC2 n=1 Tax=Andrographis paniculata TaxID=175694 RepID=UPI0021E8D17D|nr:mitochondrial arginine transporter BAC2 [Andrographis paniculata]
MSIWSEFLESSWGTEFVAGGIGGSVGVLVGQPLDTVRIRQQQAKNGSSAVAIFRQIVAREGPGSLFRGMLGPLVSISFQNAVTFQSYNTLSRSLNSRTSTPDEPSPYTTVALAGVGSGVVQSALISPIELVKIRQQLHPPSPGGALRQILQSHGSRGLFRGLAATVLRDAPGHGMYFWAYEYLRERLHPGCRKHGGESLTTTVVAGGTAGAASWLVCYPVDVLKTRIQAAGPYTGMVDCCRKSVASEGYSVLWRGLGTTLGRAFVVNGVVFTAYETAVRCIHSHRDDHAAVRTPNVV